MNWTLIMQLDFDNEDHRRMMFDELKLLEVTDNSIRYELLVEQLREWCDDAASEMGHREDTIDKLNDEISDLENRNNDLEDELNDAYQEIDELKDELAEIKEKLNG